LWWPPTKIAGRELSRHFGGESRHIAAAESEGVKIRQPACCGTMLPALGSR
jgi:hypothetical protein